MRVREHDGAGTTRFSFPSQSKPQSIITSAVRYETSSDVCIRCRRVRASISPRVPRNVSLIYETIKRFHKCCSHRPTAGPHSALDSDIAGRPAGPYLQQNVLFPTAHAIYLLIERISYDADQQSFAANHARRSANRGEGEFEPCKGSKLFPEAQQGID